VKPEHLYVHVPFCLRRCGYCDFAVTATSAAPVDAWLAAVAAELQQRRDAEGWASPLRLRTIYVGGGTPSLLGTNGMTRLADVLSRFASWGTDVEWTSEANPESFTAGLAAEWVKTGVNRLSLGAQTFHEPALRWMGRLHGAEGPARATAAAREAGLDNISVDLMFGLPGHLGRDWATDLGLALELRPAHISLYGLTAEPDTPLGRRVQEGREQLAGEDRYAAEYRLAATRLRAAGFDHYEVSNFARPGCESRHNQAYWRHRAYLGLGPGAHSFLPPVRSWNVRDWAEYSQRLADGQTVVEASETLHDAELAMETIWLGLRATDGLSTGTLSGGQQALARSWVASGLAEPHGERLCLTVEGWLLLDRLAVELEARAVDGPLAVQPHS
jgi:oxygen-independent coproporphyrinogen III oxidase